MMTKTDSYEVNRSTQAVGATFKQRAQQCLGVQVRTVSQTSTSYQNILTTYKPTVVARAASAPSLHVQQLHERGVIYPQKPPEGGVYIFVADAMPVSGNRTKIQLMARRKAMTCCTGRSAAGLPVKTSAART